MRAAVRAQSALGTGRFREVRPAQRSVCVLLIAVCCLLPRDQPRPALHRAAGILCRCLSLARSCHCISAVVGPHAAGPHGSRRAPSPAFVIAPGPCDVTTAPETGNCAFALPGGREPDRHLDCLAISHAPCLSLRWDQATLTVATIAGRGLGRLRHPPWIGLEQVSCSYSDHHNQR